MNNKGLPDRRLIRARRRKRATVIRQIKVALIAVLFVLAIILLIYWINGSNKNVAQTDISSDMPSETSILTTSTTTTTTATTSTTMSAALTSTKAAPVGDEYFADACFIGDSRTQGLMMYSAPDTATFYAIKGMTVASFFNNKAFEKKTLTAENILKKKKYNKVYVMLGLNELGWSYSSSFINRYGDLVDSVKASQPNAKIFIQSILPVSAAKSASHPNFNNPKILEYNKMIFNMCVQKKVIYLNVREAVEDEKGNLPDDATTDGIHMNRTYCNEWMAYLRTHTEVTAATQTTVAATSVSSTSITSGTKDSAISTTKTP